MHNCGTRALHDGSPCLENPRPVGAETSLTGRTSSPFQTEPRQKQHLQYCFLEVLDYRGNQDALGAPARLCHRNSESRTPVAKRISGGGEPDPEKSDQGSATAFGRTMKTRLASALVLGFQLIGVKPKSAVAMWSATRIA
jgi:hypothetical protein